MWHLFFPSWSSQYFWTEHTLWTLRNQHSLASLSWAHWSSYLQLTSQPNNPGFPIPWVFHPEKICTKETPDPKNPTKEFFKWPRSAHRSPNSPQSSHVSGYSIHPNETHCMSHRRSQLNFSPHWIATQTAHKTYIEFHSFPQSVPNILRTKHIASLLKIIVWWSFTL
jgi:hypothetical protein